MGSIGRRLQKVNKTRKGKASGPRTDMAAVKRMMKGLSGGEKWFNPVDGENVIRILPADSTDGNFAYERSLHYGFRVDGQKKALPCMLTLGKDYCPACQLIAAYEDDTDDDIIALLRKIRPSKHYLMNVIDRNSRSIIKIYSATPGAMRQILDVVADSDYGDVTDPEEGRDLKIKKSGNGESTRYKVMVRPNVSPVGLEGWEEKLHNLKKEAYSIIPNNSEYLKYLEDSFGDVLDVTEVLAGAKKKKAKMDFEEDEEEEIDEDTEEENDEEIEEDDEEEEEVIKPKKKVVKPVKKVKRIVEEDDDDDED